MYHRLMREGEKVKTAAVAGCDQFLKESPTGSRDGQDWHGRVA